MGFVQKYGILFLFIQVFTACAREGGLSPEPPEPPVPPVFEDTVDVAFRMRTAPVTYAMTDDMENHLETVDVLAFKENENNEFYFAYHAKGKDIIDISTSQKQFTATLKIDSLRYQFVILANVREEIERIGYISTTQTKEQVVSYILSKNTEKWNSSANYKPIPMWGETNLMKIGNTSSINNIHLLRALSRIDVLIEESIQPLFKLHSVYLYNRKSRGHVIPEPAYWDPLTQKVTAPTVPDDNDPSEPLNIRGPVMYDSVSVKELRRTIYTYEAGQVPLNDRLDASCLVIGGYYAGETTPSYYRIDLLDDAQTVHRNLLRNHLYEIEVIAVSGSGYSTPDAAFEGHSGEMEIIITTWNMSNMEIVIEGTYSLKVNPSKFLLQDDEAHVLVSNILTTYPRGWGFHVNPNDIAEGFNASKMGDDLWIDVPAVTGSNVHPYYININAGNLFVSIIIERRSIP